MAKKKKEKYIIYTDQEELTESETLAPNEQMLHLCLEKKNRGGKTATIIRNFHGTEDDLKDLGKILKTKCGTGGSVKNGEIIIQGDVRTQIMSILSQMGYGHKRIGG